MDNKIDINIDPKIDINIDPKNLESETDNIITYSDQDAQVAVATDQMIRLAKSTKSTKSSTLGEKYKLKYLKAKKLYYSIK
jgi:hypothetical protein